MSVQLDGVEKLEVILCFAHQFTPPIDLMILSAAAYGEASGWEEGLLFEWQRVYLIWRTWFESGRSQRRDID